MPTNHLGQQTTDSGHVIKESERIAHDLMKMLGDDGPLIQRVAAYVMDYAHTDWSKSVKHGIQLGRKDAVRMLESLVYQTYYRHNEVILAIPLDELQKVVAALRSVSMEDIHE